MTAFHVYNYAQLAKEKEESGDLEAAERLSGFSYSFFKEMKERDPSLKYEIVAGLLLSHPSL